MKKIFICATIVASILLVGCGEDKYSDLRNKAEIRKLLTEQQKCLVKAKDIDTEIRSRIELQKQFKNLDKLFGDVQTEDKTSVQTSTGIKEVKK